MSLLQLEKSFVLHTRPYRDTSMLVDFFTENQGYITAVARGVRKAKSTLKGILQPFTPLLINWYGKTELMTLRTAEINQAPFLLKQNNLLSGLYLNELILRVITRFDPHPVLYNAYHQAMGQLAQQQNPEIILRNFELTLLEELGYGLQLDRIVATNQNVRSEIYYDFSPHTGLIPLAVETASSLDSLFLGEYLLAIHERQFESKEILKTAKRLLRRALIPLLANKAIVSRELFL